MIVKQCRSCGKDIVWMQPAQGTKPMPMDYPGEKRWILDTADGRMRGHQVETFSSHFATCPHADQWRNR